MPRLVVDSDDEVDEDDDCEWPERLRARPPYLSVLLRSHAPSRPLSSDIANDEEAIKLELDEEDEDIAVIAQLEAGDGDKDDIQSQPASNGGDNRDAGSSSDSDVDTHDERCSKKERIHTTLNAQWDEDSFEAVWRKAVEDGGNDPDWDAARARIRSGGGLPTAQQRVARIVEEGLATSALERKIHQLDQERSPEEVQRDPGSFDDEGKRKMGFVAPFMR